MKLLKAIAFILLIATVGFSQKKVTEQPPPPKIAKTTQIWESDGFKINFPANPVRNTKLVKTAFGDTQSVNYELSSTIAYYKVSYIDFPTVIEDRAELLLRLDAVKSVYLQKNKLVSETEILFGDNLGMDYVFEGADFTITTRLLFIKQRFFEFLIVNKGKFSRASEKAKAITKRNNDNFINSFSVTKLPEVKSLAVELPEDFGVTIENDIFSTKFFNFSIQLPKGWKLLNKDEMELVTDIGLQMTDFKSKAKNEYLAKSVSNAKFLVFATAKSILEDGGTQSFVIASEKVSFPNFVPSMVVKSFGKHFLEDDEKITKMTNFEKIGGEDFAWIEIENKVEKYKQRLYVSNQKGIAFQLLFTYRNPAEMIEMLNLLKTAKFDKK